LIDTDAALEQAGIVIGLVDLSELKIIDSDVLKAKVIINVCGIWR